MYANPITNGIFTGAETTQNLSNKLAGLAASALANQQNNPSRNNMTVLLKMVGARSSLQNLLNNANVVRAAINSA